MTVQPDPPADTGRPSRVAPGPDAPGSRRTLRRVLAWAGAIVGGLVAALVLFVLLFDWNSARGVVARFASQRMHREVAIDGDLVVRPWSFSPSVTVNGLRIGDPAWAGPGRTASIDRLLVRIKLLPLLRGQVVLLTLEADRPDLNLRRDSQGRATWDFSGGEPKDKPLTLPAIKRFIIRDGHLKLVDDKRKLILDAKLDASEKAGSAGRGFQLSGDGLLNGNKFLLAVQGGPLLNVTPNTPYPFDADIRAGATHLLAKGSIPKPFDLGHLTVDIQASGPDMDDLYELTGVSFPNTPPYQLKGRLVRDGALYTITGLNGRVGDSDLAGSLSVETKNHRPFLKADLRSRDLDFGDLATIFGGAPPARPGKVLSSKELAVAQALRDEHRLLPDATLKVERIRALDADVRFTATSIHDSPVSLSSAAVHVLLDHGLLTVDPVTLQLPQGRITGRAQLDARPEVPITDVDFRLSNGRLEHLIPVKSGGVPVLTGSLVGRIKLRGAGNSVHRAAANANGQVLIVAPNGEIRRAFAELLGVDLTKGLGLLLANSQETTPIRCAVADFRVQGGVLSSDRLIFDTGPVLGTGRGSIDLDREQMDFTIQGRPKQFRLVRLMAPITIKGPILSPKVGVNKGQAIAQGGAAALLATVASPLALVLPFVDAGLAKDAGCGALIAEAGRQGAPVTSPRAPRSRPHG